MQLSETLLKVPHDLFHLKEKKVQEHLSQADEHKPQSQPGDAPNQKQANKRQIDLTSATSTATPVPDAQSSLPSKRVRVMTMRMHGYSAQLNMLRQSLAST